MNKNTETFKQRAGRVANLYFALAGFLLIWALFLGGVLLSGHTPLSRLVFVFSSCIDAELAFPIVSICFAVTAVMGGLALYLEKRFGRAHALWPFIGVLLGAYASLYAPGNYQDESILSRLRPDYPLENIDIYGPRDRAMKHIAPIYVTEKTRLKKDGARMRCPRVWVEKIGPIYIERYYDFDPRPDPYASRYDTQRDDSSSRRRDLCERTKRAIEARHDWQPLDEATLVEWVEKDYMTDYRSDFDLRRVYHAS